MINMQKDNITIMVGVDINEVINELFESLFIEECIQECIETLRGSHFVFDGIEKCTLTLKNIA